MMTQASGSTKRLKLPASHGRGRSFRVIAVMTLAVLTVTAAWAGVLRECLGQDGRHGIELAQSESSPHARLLNFQFDSSAEGYGNLHHSGETCVDRLLFADAFSSRGICAGKSKPVVFPLAPTGTQNFTQRTARLIVLRPWDNVVDPRLKALRTVVLLN